MTEAVMGEPAILSETTDLQQLRASLVADLERMDSSARLLVEACDEINALDGWPRHQELIALARSPIFHPASLMVEGVPGAIHREAWKALKRDAEADTPARRWHKSDYSRGRQSIRRLLAAETWPIYACLPFRTVDADNGPRIGAAIGGERLLSGRGWDFYSYLDITDVLLWDPATNVVELADEPGAARLIMPSEDNEFAKLKIYRDPAAFFQDWVMRRVEALALYAAGHKHFETRDGCLPGALAVGDPGAIAWHRVHASALVAGAGFEARDLAQLVRGSYRIPPVMEDAYGGAI